MYKEIFKNNSKQDAKNLVNMINILSKSNIHDESSWIKICDNIGYEYKSAFNSKKEMTSKFRCIIVNINLLAIHGYHNCPNDLIDTF